MGNNVGFYSCSIDEKNRMRIPIEAIEDLGLRDGDTIMINKLSSKHLNIYTERGWGEAEATVAHLNYSNSDHRKILQQYYHFSSKMKLDKSNRVLIPKNLLENMKITTSAILRFVQGNMELWNPEKYKAEHESQLFDDDYEFNLPINV